MRLGLIARSDRTGLGYQTKAYFDHLKPDKTLVVDISMLNGKGQNFGWYTDSYLSRGIPSTAVLDGFLNDLDVVLTAETPYNYKLYSMARDRGVKTAVVYNYEFFDWFKYPEYPLPDLLIAPSKWHFKEVDNFAKSKRVKHIYLHHPVDRKDFPFLLRHTAKPLHIAGNPAAHDRNGTWDFIQAVPNGTVVTQSEDLAKHLRWRYRNCRVLTNIELSSSMYKLGDVLILPRKYGGNCLPLNEALSCGLPVIMPDISPNNELLPKEWLLPAMITDTFTPRTSIDIYSVQIDAIRDKLKWFEDNDIQEQSRKADEIAESISWDTLKPKWVEALESI